MLDGREAAIHLPTRSEILQASCLQFQWRLAMANRVPMRRKRRVAHRLGRLTPQAQGSSALKESQEYCMGVACHLHRRTQTQPGPFLGARLQTPLASNPGKLLRRRLRHASRPEWQCWDSLNGWYAVHAHLVLVAHGMPASAEESGLG